MSKHGKRSLAALVALALAWGIPRAGSLARAAGEQSVTAAAAEEAPARNLRAVGVATDASGQPVVTLQGDGRIAYRSQVLEAPSRLVLDLDGVVSRLRAHQFDVGQGSVIRVRAGQYRSSPEPVSRVVFDLEKPVPYEIAWEGSSLVVRFGEETVAEASEPVSQAPGADEVASLDPAPPAATEVPEPAPAVPHSLALSPEEIDRILRAPALAQEAPAPKEERARVGTGTTFETRKIVTETTQYTGKKISLNLVDADIKQVFRLFHEISGINFVLDPSVEGQVTIVLDEVPWDQALDIILKNNGLDKIYENNVIRIATTAKLAQEAAARKQLKEAKELEAEAVTITRTLSYAKAKDVERVIRDSGVLTARGKVFTDERTNTLIVSDIPKKVEPLDTLLTSLDTETPQVMIEARIVETSRSFTQDFGVVWGLNAFADAAHGTATRFNFPHNASVRYGLNLPGANQASSLAFHFGNILDSLTLDVALNALETEGRGRILSSPKITAQNNERAEIEQGVRIPVVNTTATEINVEFVSASLRLQVTPQITAEGTVVLDIQVENNTPDFVNRVGDVPPVNTQRATTKVLINDGGTAVIGGIFTVNEGTSEQGVPWFRKIPVLGWLFKSRNITNENRELLIFITPKIIKIG